MTLEGMPMDAPSSKPPRYNQQRVADFFRVHVRLYGNDWRALGWQSRATQVGRFSGLAEIGPLAQTQGLYVGCGLGDLYGYLCDQGTSVTYMGYDLVPQMGKGASQPYPLA